MNTLPRHAIRAFVLVVLLAVTPLPTTLSVPVSLNGLGPRAAWAGGSPDETLKPVPPRSRSIRPDGSPRVERQSTRSRDRIQWILVWKAYTPSVLMRF